MELAFSRFGFALLAVFATGGMILLWHLWLERRGLGTKVLALTAFFGLLALIVRYLRGLSGIE